MKKIFGFLVPLLLLAGCNAPASPEDASVSAEEIAVDLDVPWAINKLDEEFYISERPGTVMHIDSDGNQQRQQVQFSDPVSSASEAGFLGFVLKDDFRESGEAYGYYVYESDGNPYNKIITLLLEEDKWRETEILLEGVPTGNVHHGGRIGLDDEGTLFAAIGDASEPDLAQDPGSVNGKILRLNEQNEFEIFSRGHRNPQGLAWAEGVMYASEHGQSANDEINIIQEGNNYGWPIIEGNETETGLESPFYTTGSSETWAPSGITVQDDILYVSALRGAAIHLLDLETAEVLESIEGYGRIRDVFSDGENIYFITNNTDGRGTASDGDDRLYRLDTE